MTLAAIYHFYGPLFGGPPAKRAMTGDLNVAVAGFASAAGTDPVDASGLSDSLYRALRSSLPAELKRGAGLDIRIDVLRKWAASSARTPPEPPDVLALS